MMRIYLSPQNSDVKSIIKINGDKVQVDNKLYDFTNLPNGILRQFNDDILDVKRIDGELYVTIINRLDDSATQDELYPQWRIVERNNLLDNNLISVELDWYSDDERALDESLSVLQPTPEEIEVAEFEVKLIDKLLEWGIL